MTSFPYKQHERGLYILRLDRHRPWQDRGRKEGGREGIRKSIHFHLSLINERALRSGGWVFYISPARAHVTQTCPKAKRSSTIYKQAAAPRSESYRQTDTDYVNVIQCSAYDMNQVAGSQSVSQSVSQSHVSIGVVGRGRFVSTTDKKPRHRHNTCALRKRYVLYTHYGT